MKSYSDIIFKFLLAALLGGVIGAEREYRSKSAGFRTLILISVGSCFFTILSMSIGGNSPDRIASNILTGIGFLGAGVIFKGDHRVNGITTAATIWVVSAVGMGVGMGMYVASIMVSILIFFILAILPFLEILMDRFNQTKSFTLEFKFDESCVQYVRNKCTEYHIHFKISNIIKQDDHVTIYVWTKGKEKNLIAFENSLWNDSTILNFKT